MASGGSTRQAITSTAPPKNAFKLSLRLLVKRNYPYLLRETDLGRLLGLKPRFDMFNAYRWNDGRHQMTQDATIRVLIVLLWDALGIAKATDLWAVDWEARDVLWRHGRETRMRNGDVLNPLWLPHTAPAVRDYLLSRGIDPFDKPAPRPLFDPYEHTSLSVKGRVIMDRRGGGERPGVALQNWTTRRLP